MQADTCPPTCAQKATSYCPGCFIISTIYARRSCKPMRSITASALVPEALAAEKRSSRFQSGTCDSVYISDTGRLRMQREYAVRCTDYVIQDRSWFDLETWMYLPKQEPISRDIDSSWIAGGSSQCSIVCGMADIDNQSEWGRPRKTSGW